MKTFSENEVKELLRKQREICAKLVEGYRYNKLFKQIVNAPEPKTK